MRRIAGLLCGMFVVLGLMAACQTMGGNEGGSQPLNEVEEVEYKKSLLRCYKTGGSRIVKIAGELKCY